jgi:DNA-binding NtrC family response regulator
MKMKTGLKDTFRHVLVVDDDRRVREMLLDAIADMGFEVGGAANAEAALKAIAQNEPDIAILDLNLPGIGGLDLFEQIHDRNPSVQVIVLTGYGDLDAARRAIRLNVVDFLSKPCSLGELEQAIQRARSRRAALTTPAGAPAPDSVPTSIPATAPGDSFSTSWSQIESLEDLERVHIFAALRKHNNNREQTANALGISVRKLYYRLQQYEQQGAVPEELKSVS